MFKFHVTVNLNRDQLVRLREFFRADWDLPEEGGLTDQEVAQALADTAQDALSDPKGWERLTQAMHYGILPE